MFFQLPVKIIASYIVVFTTSLMNVLTKSFTLYFYSTVLGIDRIMFLPKDVVSNSAKLSTE